MPAVALLAHEIASEDVIVVVLIIVHVRVQFLTEDQQTSEFASDKNIRTQENMR